MLCVCYAGKAGKKRGSAAYSKMPPPPVVGNAVVVRAWGQVQEGGYQGQGQRVEVRVEVRVKARARVRVGARVKGHLPLTRSLYLARSHSRSHFVLSQSLSSIFSLS